MKCLKGANEKLFKGHCEFDNCYVKTWRFKSLDSRFLRAIFLRAIIVDPLTKFSRHIQEKFQKIITLIFWNFTWRTFRANCVDFLTRSWRISIFNFEIFSRILRASGMYFVYLNARLSRIFFKDPWKIVLRTLSGIASGIFIYFFSYLQGIRPTFLGIFNAFQRKSVHFFCQGPSKK